MLLCYEVKRLCSLSFVPIFVVAFIVVLPLFKLHGVIAALLNRRPNFRSLSFPVVHLVLRILFTVVVVAAILTFISSVLDTDPDAISVLPPNLQLLLLLSHRLLCSCSAVVVAACRVPSR